MSLFTTSCIAFTLFIFYKSKCPQIFKKCFLKLFLFPGLRRVHSPSRIFTLCRYNIWQDAGIRTRVAANAAKCATNELHTSLPKVPLFAVKYISHLKIIQFFVSLSEQNINNIDRPLHPGCSGIEQSNKYRLDRVLPSSYLLFL